MFQRTRRLVQGIRNSPGKAPGVAILLLFVGGGAAVGGVNLWAEYHYQAAQRALARRDYASATEHVSHCLSIWPRSGLCHLLAARIARHSLDVASADQHLTEYQERLGLTDALELERVLLQAQQGDTRPIERYVVRYAELKGEGRKEALKCLTQHPEGEDIFEAMTQGYMDSYRLTQALSCLSVWLEWQPNNLQPLFMRGWVRSRQTNLSAALEDYLRVVELDPAHIEARLLATDILFQLVRYEEARDQLLQVAKTQPDHPEVLLGLARCEADRGNLKEARDHLDWLLTLNPNHTNGLIERGKIALHLEGAPKAEVWLNKALSQDPFEKQANYLYYHCLEQIPGRENEAEKQLEKLNRVTADIDRLAEIVGHLMSENPNNPDLHYESGLIFLRNGQENSGLKWFYSALQINPTHKPTCEALADYFEKAGKPDVAARYRDSR